MYLFFFSFVFYFFILFLSLTTSSNIIYIPFISSYNWHFELQDLNILERAYPHISKVSVYYSLSYSISLTLSITFFLTFFLSPLFSLSLFHTLITSHLFILSLSLSLSQWDIVMDWGIFTITRKGRIIPRSRQRMSLPLYLYIFAAIINLILRFSWAANRIPQVRNFSKKRLIFF